jgi:hypothetical protein
MRIKELHNKKSLICKSLIINKQYVSDNRMKYFTNTILHITNLQPNV